MAQFILGRMVSSSESDGIIVGIIADDSPDPDGILGGGAVEHVGLGPPRGVKRGRRRRK